MNIVFEPMTKEHGKEVMDIFNYYIESGFSAYPENILPYEFFGKFLEMTTGYPAFVIRNTDKDKTIGFCFLRPYNPFPSFKISAEITYFISENSTGKEIGKAALNLLEEKARERGIKNIIADISSENQYSLRFHEKNGFKECGRLYKVGSKKGKEFDVVWMQKSLD